MTETKRGAVFSDGWVTGFLVVALAALVITSVGTFELFDYLLPWELAAAATVVLAAGIPLLKFAATFDKRRRRSYLAIMAAFLVVELVAQYFKAQASFSKTVAGTTALAGSDLALAAADGTASRVLAFLFLASLPLVVVVMTHAAAERLVVGRSPVARIRRIVARTRARLRRARAEVAPIRAELAQARASLAQYETWLRVARAELERERARPVLTVETAAELFVQMGAPESTVRGWRKRLIEGEVEV